MTYQSFTQVLIKTIVYVEQNLLQKLAKSFLSVAHCKSVQWANPFEMNTPPVECLW